MNRLENRTALITGAGLGIGKATALLLAKEGANVAVTDILHDEGNAVVNEIILNGGQAGYWHLDTTSEIEVSNVVSDIKHTFGQIDILVNNAGITGANKPTHELSVEEWDNVMNVNVKGVFLCTKHVIPYMIEIGGGSIINLSSIYGLVGAPDIPPYHASKGAVRLMTKTDALLYAKYKIRVNSVHPGFIWTPLVEHHLEKMGSVDDGRKMLDSLHPLGHIGEPIDIAYGILYLASDESKFVTGSELVIDGGYTAK
ncbi:MAG: glucose 1-dehydrogenase [Ignavibacteria bacterium]